MVRPQQAPTSLQPIGNMREQRLSCDEREMRHFRLASLLAPGARKGMGGGEKVWGWLVAVGVREPRLAPV